MLKSRAGETPEKKQVSCKYLETEQWFLSATEDPEDDPDPPPGGAQLPGSKRGLNLAEI